MQSPNNEKVTSDEDEPVKKMKKMATQNSIEEVLSSWEEGRIEKMKKQTVMQSPTNEVVTGWTSQKDEKRWGSRLSRKKVVTSDDVKNKILNMRKSPN